MDECAKMVASAIMSDVNVCIDWCVLIPYLILTCKTEECWQTGGGAHDDTPRDGPINAEKRRSL